jgi:hypothetical protein
MKQEAPEFRKGKLGEEFQGDFAGSVGMVWSPAARLSTWLVLQFVRDRDYVFLRLYWSKDGEEPSHQTFGALVDQLRRAKPGASVKDYVALQRGTVDSSDFDDRVTRFPIALEFPPRERIRPIMSRPESQRILAIVGHDGDRWEGQLGSDGWHSIVMYGNEKLTEADAQVAVGPTLHSVISFARTHMLPFARQVAASAGQ